MSFFKRKARDIARSNEGVAFIEFALCMPFLLILFFGTVEVARYFLAIQKVEKTVDLVTDTLAQANMSSPTEMLTPLYVTSLFSTVPDMMNPYEINPVGSPSRGIVIVTDITQGADLSQPPIINWQACGGGTLAHTSGLGTSSGDHSHPNNATLPAGFTMLANEEVVIGEFYYNFSPILLQDIISDIPMTRIVYFIPRAGAGNLSTYSSTCP